MWPRLGFGGMRLQALHLSAEFTQLLAEFANLADQCRVGISGSGRGFCLRTRTLESTPIGSESTKTRTRPHRRAVRSLTEPHVALLG